MADVICDTSPLQYLHQLGLLHLLRDFHHTLIVPPAVANELAEGRERGIDLPNPAMLPWMVERRPTRRVVAAAGLGPGESEVLTLAGEFPEVLVILDDARARRAAEENRFRVTGTLGVLLRAKSSAHLPAIAPALDRLQQLGFHIAPRTRSDVLDLAGES